MSKKANLRVCMSCEWIFTGRGGCPKCNWPSYGARYVYGARAYRHAQTQKPWFDKKMFAHAAALQKEIDVAKPQKPSLDFPRVPQNAAVTGQKGGVADGTRTEAAGCP